MGLAEVQQDGTCQCPLQGQGQGVPVARGWLEVASPMDRREGEAATQLIPTSKVLKASGHPAWRRFAGEQVHRLLFEAPPLWPADHEAGAREWPVCLWLQVFSLQTRPGQVSPFPCVMRLPRTQA